MVQPLQSTVIRYLNHPSRSLENDGATPGLQTGALKPREEAACPGFQSEQGDLGSDPGPAPAAPWALINPFTLRLSGDCSSLFSPEIHMKQALPTSHRHRGC